MGKTNPVSRTVLRLPFVSPATRQPNRLRRSESYNLENQRDIQLLFELISKTKLTTYRFAAHSPKAKPYVFEINSHQHGPFLLFLHYGLRYLDGVNGTETPSLPSGCLVIQRLWR